MPTRLLILLLFACPTQAEQFYRWTDEKGVTHFSDSPAPNAHRIEIRAINTYQAPSLPPARPRKESVEKKRQPKVVMYGAEWCGVCKRARAYFDEHDIRYTEYDVDRSAKGKRDYKRMKGNGVPIILVDDQRMNGFSEVSFERLLSSTR